MNGKRKAPPRQLTDRESFPSMTVNGRKVERGAEVSVTGIRGRCVFIARTVHESGTEWVDVITSRGFACSIRPETIRTAHRTRRISSAAA